MAIVYITIPLPIQELQWVIDSIKTPLDFVWRSSTLILQGICPEGEYGPGRLGADQFSILGTYSRKAIKSEKGITIQFGQQSSNYSGNRWTEPTQVL